jgi:ribose-phosphate pyrophosphokinase
VASRAAPGGNRQPAPWPIPDDRRFGKLTARSIAPLIARASNEVFSDGSVTSLFGGNS